MDKNCVFCRVISGEFPSEKLYEDDVLMVIKDVSPAAPDHVLILPKKHTANIMKTSKKTIVAMFDKVPEIVKRLGIEKSGFRLIINTGEDGGQTVSHTHIHVLGGREMQWPPG
jgi:histidine triad (HIT) family protein